MWLLPITCLFLKLEGQCLNEAGAVRYSEDYLIAIDGGGVGMVVTMIVVNYWDTLEMKGRYFVVFEL